MPPIPAVRPVPPRKMKIVVLQLQRIRHRDVLCRPTPMFVFQIARSVLQPYSNVPLSLLADLERIHVAPIEYSWLPLDTGKTSDARKNPGEFPLLHPRPVERADPARNVARPRPAISIRTPILCLGNFPQH